MNEEKMKKIKVVTVILGILLLLMLAYSFYEHYQDINNQLSIYEVNLKNKNDKLIKYKNDIEELKRKNLLYEAQISFMNNHVAICPLDGSGLYHKYNCEYLDTSSFMIYNTEQAPNEGYSPCSHCYENMNTSSNTDTEIVYITNTGAKYHREWCSYLKSKKAIEKSKAVEEGYEPCDRCNP